MEFEGHTGCFDFEKKDGQKFIVSLDICLDRIKGCYTDELSDTVDYAKIYDITKDIVTSDKGNLIESLAQKISDKIMCVKGDVIPYFGTPDEIFGSPKSDRLKGFLAKVL